MHVRSEHFCPGTKPGQNTTEPNFSVPVKLRPRPPSPTRTRTYHCMMGKWMTRLTELPSLVCCSNQENEEVLKEISHYGLIMWMFMDDD